MISYSIKDGLFSSDELNYYNFTQRFITDLVEPKGKTYTCHELARAVGMVFGLPVQDGYYENIQHSWLWTHNLPKLPNKDHSPWPNILDVYVPGVHPQVQLINFSTSILPARRTYLWTVPVIFSYDQEVVTILAKQFLGQLVK